MKLIPIALLTSALVAAFPAMSFAAPESFDFEKLKCRKNLETTPIGGSSRWTLEKLMALTGAEGLELWRSLPPPSIKEMKGHYMGLRPSPEIPA